MSSLWAPEDSGGRAAVAGWTNLAAATGGSFRSRFATLPDEPRWTATTHGHRPGGADMDMPAEPEVDRVEQASRDGFIAGFQEGERLTRESLEGDDAARLALAAAIAQIGDANEGALASIIGQAVIRLVTQVVGEVPIDEARLAERCAAVAACIDPDDNKAVLEVNPLDLPLIDADGIGVRLAANGDLGRGSVRLATADGWIEDGPDVRLDRLRALLDDMEGRR